MATEYQDDYNSRRKRAPVHQLLANIQLARSRKAPKIIIENARELTRSGSLSGFRSPCGSRSRQTNKGTREGTLPRKGSQTTQLYRRR